MNEQRWKDQTSFYDPEDDSSGNCTQAAVASLLDLPLDSVPNFKEADTVLGFWDAFEDFLLEQGFWTLRKDSNYCPEGYYLAGGPAERGCDHMVVMHSGKLVHDPHFSRAGLLKVEHVWLLIPVDPAQHPSKT